MSVLNAMTVDVEDYYQVSAFEGVVDRRDWDHLPSRVEASTYRLLELFDRWNVKCTFFVLGWVARRFPQLVCDIDAAGHEIGSHSFWHRLVYLMSREEFREDLRLSRDVLQDLVGKPITLYRAPSFSITRRSLWALEVLAEEGFTQDSSVVPAWHDRYGVPGAEPRIHQIRTAAGSITEFPPSVAHVCGLRLPISGGGYFRFYPWSMTRHLLRAVNRREQRPFVFYMHPWEVDPDQPRLPGSLVSRFRHYVNLGSTKSRLESLLASFSFGKLSDSVTRHCQQNEMSGGDTLPLVQLARLPTPQATHVDENAWHAMSWTLQQLDPADGVA